MHQNSLDMEEKKKGRGRPATGINTIDIHYKMAKDLYDALPSSINRNGYINDAVREKMIQHGYINEDVKKE